MVTSNKTKTKWYYQFMLNGERKHGLCPGASNRKEAEQYENAIKYRLAQQQNGVIPREEKNVPFSKLKDLYDNYARNNKRSYKNDKYIVKIISEFFGDSTIVQGISPSNIESFKEHLKNNKKLKNSSINKYLMVLSKIFNLGIDNELIAKNPVAKVHKLGEDNHKIRYLTIGEEQRLFAAIEKTYEVTDRNTKMKKLVQPYLFLKPIITVALHTGMRKNEILKLQWNNIDLEHNFIELLDTKSGKARKIPISSKLKDIFYSTPKVSEFVFINPKTNKPYNCLRKSFTKILGNANIKNFRFHDLRHTVATRLVEKGVDICVVQDILGHSKITTTQRYAHPVPERKANAIEILNTYTKSLQNILKAFLLVVYNCILVAYHYLQVLFI